MENWKYVIEESAKYSMAAVIASHLLLLKATDIFWWVH